MPRNPHARSILVRRAIAASLLSTLVLLGFGHRPTQAQAPPATPPAGPFGPTDFDAVYSDRSWVHYRVSRTCLADVATCLGQPGQTSLCSAGQPITGLSCAAGVHRFCQAKGQLSGWGVETAGDPSQVDITCVRAAAAETRTLAHAELQAQHAGCTTAMPGLACASAADRYCRTQNGFTLGFGPLERNASVAVITCVRTDASTAFGGVAASEVEAYAAGCALGAPEVSTA
ncbi:MAG TPA: hypothetical protein VFC77_00525, partial [Myxococcota bacterium]|nr:hypothetical protein [Myxococcota bacterium]